MHFEHSTLIPAPLDVVWRLTTDIAAWPSFMTTVESLQRLDSGTLRVGSSARVKNPGRSASVWTVTRIEDKREFTWETRRPGFRMTGRHLLTPVPEGTRNTLVIDLDGWASGLVGALAGGTLRRSIQGENESFLRAAQPSSATS